MTGLIGWWPLHEDSGRASDLSGNGNHGTLSGGVTQGVAGRGGLTAYSFDGVDGEVALPAQTLGNSFTVALWVYPRSNTPDETQDHNFWTHKDGDDDYRPSVNIRQKRKQ